MSVHSSNPPQTTKEHLPEPERERTELELKLNPTKRSPTPKPYPSACTLHRIEPWVSHEAVHLIGHQFSNRVEFGAIEFRMV